MAANPTIYAQITRLARSGSLERAWSLLEESGLADADNDPRALSLRARLEKDRAKRSDAGERVSWLEQSAGHYLQAAEISQTSYPLINAASLNLLAGKPGRAAQLARQVLDLLEANPNEAETPYWRGATQAEALLLLGKVPDARARLRKAINETPKAWEDHAATIGQFTQISAEMGNDAGWLGALRPPRSVQYAGIMAVELDNPSTQKEIAGWLEQENIGFGFGALAAGADIWIAEALLARGGDLHVVLPCPADVFREKSVCAVDPAWGPRFDALLEQALFVDELEIASDPSVSGVQLTDAVATGMAIHYAGLLQSKALQLRISAEGEAASPSAGKTLRNASLTARRRSAPVDFQMDEGNSFKACLRSSTNGQVHTPDQKFDTIGQAWAAAHHTIGSNASAALDYCFDGDSAQQAVLSRRLSAMAEVALPGQVLASKAVAFSLLAQVPQLHIEPLGELRSADGIFPFFAIS